MESKLNWYLEYQGQRYIISTNGLHIGRGQENDVVLRDDQVSRQHAFVWDKDGIVFVRDEVSTNGTFVNGKRINEPTPLFSNARLQIGSSVFVLRSNAEQSQAQPSFANRLSSRWIILLAVILGIVLILALLIITALISPNSSTRTAPTVPLITISATAQSMSAIPTRNPNIDAQTRALLATVGIECPFDGSRQAIYGSGSILDEAGLILTNWHVVHDLANDQPCNRQGIVYVHVNTAPDRPPTRLYRAQVIAFDTNLDIALLRLTAQENGAPLTPPLELETIPLGDSDQVQIGERLRVIGFPGLGGDTLTLTEGIVSGFLQDRAWFKTDTEISHGNSGGTAINRAGELIGIPTIAVSDPSLNSKIGLVRPINLVKPLIEQARK